MHTTCTCGAPGIHCAISAACTLPAFMHAVHSTYSTRCHCRPSALDIKHHGYPAAYAVSNQKGIEMTTLRSPVHTAQYLPRQLSFDNVNCHPVKSMYTPNNLRDVPVHITCGMCCMLSQSMSKLVSTQSRIHITRGHHLPCQQNSNITRELSSSSSRPCCWPG